jgi:hypothetical protein
MIKELYITFNQAGKVVHVTFYRDTGQRREVYPAYKYTESVYALLNSDRVRVTRVYGSPVRHQASLRCEVVPKPYVYDSIQEQRVFEYLDELRTSGITNTFAAAPYIASRFINMTPTRAVEYLLKWISTYGRRHHE